MDLAWLEDFLALVDLGHFSKAAGRRNITQPAFSRRVRLLEDWVGAPLFEREGQPVALTPAGERFRPVAEEVLRRLYQGREATREASRAAAATLRFASTQVLSFSFFPRWLRTIEKQEQHHATIVLTASHMAACEQLMLRGDAQFLICHHHPRTSNLLSTEQFQSVRVGRDALLAVSAPRPDGGGPLFQLRSGSTEALPFLAYTGESGLGRILAASRTVEQCGRPLDPVFASHLTSVLTALARDGRGLTWAPMSIVSDDLRQGSLVRASDAGDDVPIEIRLYRPKARQSPAAERIWAIIDSLAEVDLRSA